MRDYLPADGFRLLSDSFRLFSIFFESWFSVVAFQKALLDANRVFGCFRTLFGCVPSFSSRGFRSWVSRKIVLTGTEVLEASKSQVVKNDCKPNEQLIIWLKMVFVVFGLLPLCFALCLVVVSVVVSVRPPKSPF